jgi:hypothetical protein
MVLLVFVSQTLKFKLLLFDHVAFEVLEESLFDFGFRMFFILELLGVSDNSVLEASKESKSVQEDSGI